MDDGPGIPAGDRARVVRSVLSHRTARLRDWWQWTRLSICKGFIEAMVERSGPTRERTAGAPRSRSRWQQGQSAARSSILPHERATSNFDSGATTAQVFQMEAAAGFVLGFGVINLNPVSAENALLCNS